MPGYLKYVLFTYLMIINIITFLAFRIDKKLSKTYHRRISERTLMTLAIVGGSLGAEIGMQLFRHKTKHPKFQWGIPAILLAHVLLYYFLAN